MSSVDWDAALEQRDSVTINLGAQTEIGMSHTVSFERVSQTDEGFIVADVTCPTLEGDTLWLRGKFGPQNGLHSLVKAAKGGENIAGSAFIYQRVESENSIAGYAHRWDAE